MKEGLGAGDEAGRERAHPLLELLPLLTMAVEV
ncbi:MAG: hypothetical protein JWQ71_86, partial [Pedosphaera sp.]|nr:hypothetical protein [Pedosphaera sp.]